MKKKNHRYVVIFGISFSFTNRLCREDGLT